MFNSSVNIIFIIVLVLIFVVRTIAQAAKKKNDDEPPIPVHFEDDEPEYSTARAAVHNAAASPLGQTALPSQNRRPAQAVRPPSIKPVAAPKASPAGQTMAGAPAAEQKGFSLNLNHLSPMKQAVVMAEILGTPKGLL